MQDHEDTHLENARERIERDGPVAELLRQAYVERLRSHLEAFYEHGRLADLVGLLRVGPLPRLPIRSVSFRNQTRRDRFWA